MTTITETKTQKRKRLEKRDRYRSTVCSGCHYNYYNFPKEQSPNGDVAVPDEYSCWFITRIQRNKCTIYHRG